jgi:hypothetical protein
MNRACVLGMPANLAKDAVSLNGKMILLRARTSSQLKGVTREANRQSQERHSKPSLALLESFPLSVSLKRMKSDHSRMDPRIPHPLRKSKHWCRHEVTCTISIIYVICYKCNKMYKYPRNHFYGGANQLPTVSIDFVSPFDTISPSRPPMTSPTISHGFFPPPHFNTLSLNTSPPSLLNAPSGPSVNNVDQTLPAIARSKR